MTRETINVAGISVELASAAMATSMLATWPHALKYVFPSRY